jgi:hypothetical protein
LRQQGAGQEPRLGPDRDHVGKSAPAGAVVAAAHPPHHDIGGQEQPFGETGRHFPGKTAVAAPEVQFDDPVVRQFQQPIKIIEDEH